MFRKKRLFTAAVLALSVAACNKTDSPKPPVEEQLLNRLPRKVIYQEQYINGEEENYATGVSFQYDTVHHVIRSFAEDTSSTSTNTYRTLLAEYTYNKDGYLVRYDEIAEDGTTETSILSRQSDNRLKYITNLDHYPTQNDTAYFQYENVNGQTRLNLTRPGSAWQSADVSFYYNNDSILVKTEYNQEQHTTNYTYNGKKMMSMQHNGFDAAINLGYTSGLPDRAADSLMRVFLGPDYYLQPLRVFYPFTLIYEDDMVTVSATDPYHPTSLQVSPGLSETPGGITYNIKYSYDGLNRLTKVEMEYPGKHTGSFRFLY